MNDYDKYHIQRITKNINKYTTLELELMNEGIVRKVESLMLDNDSFQNTKEIVTYSQLNQMMVDRLDDMEEINRNAERMYEYYEQKRDFT